MIKIIPLMVLICISFGACATQHIDSLSIEYKVDSASIAQGHDTIILCCPGRATDGGPKYLQVYAKFPENEKILSYGIKEESWFGIMSSTHIIMPNAFENKDFGSSVRGPVNVSNYTGEHIIIIETTKRKFTKKFYLKEKD